MRAIVQDRFGPADVLELRTVERPRITSTEVLIEVHAAGVDRGVIERLADHLAGGAVVPVIDRAVDVEHVAEAIRDLDAGRIAGKAAVVVRSPTGVNAGGLTARE